MDVNNRNTQLGETREWSGLLLTMTEDGWRAEVEHSMHRRCRSWDYCKPRIYMITINTQHHSVPPMPILPSEPMAPSTPHQAASTPHQAAGTSLQAPGSLPLQAASTLLQAPGSLPHVVCAQPLAGCYEYPASLLALYSRRGHPHLFGELAACLDAQGKPFIELNAFGRAVEQCIMDIPVHYPETRIIDKVVMPNHVHFIIQVHHRLPEKKPLGFVINKFKSWVNRAFKEIVLGVPASTCMDIKQSAECSLPAERTGQGHGSKNPKVGLVFEPGFHDRILFRDGQLQRMIDYLRDNPRRLWEVMHNREYFEKTADWRITMPLLPDGGTKNAGRWWNCYPGGVQALLQEGKPQGLLAPIEVSKDATSLTMTFNAIGNRALMASPEKMQIQCSRRATEAEVNALTLDTLEACLHGVVPISPCMSPGEKAVARKVMDAGYPLIALFPQGIPPQTDEYKPYGQYFEACARGQLLILSPWEFKPGVQKATRWQCLLLNDVAAQASAM